MKYILKFTITKILFNLVLMLPFVAVAQRAKISNDTLIYKERRIVVGDTINVAYGSGTDGRFIFISMGSGVGGTAPMESHFAKSQVKIDKIYKNSSGIWVRGKVLESSVNALGGNKVFVTPEGAIDKKEID